MGDPVIVPVQLDALVVNQGLLARDTFRWWQFNYNALNEFKSPEPEATDRQTAGQKPGVYLHWTLPRGLRQGVQNPETGEIDYPLVPNRWVVIRYSGSGQRRADAWVVESDCPYTAQVRTVGVERTSFYLASPALIRMWQSSSDPYRNQVTLDARSAKVQVANLGISFPLQEGWTERAADTMFLTAIAPANPVFSIYYPHNAGVFSFYDDLAGIDNETLSYQVVGWFSDPQRDILATGEPDLLERLQWTLPEGADGEATASLYQGLALGVTWHRSGNPPEGDPLQRIRETGRLNVAMGNTTIDAFTALVDQQLRAKGYDAQAARLLKAFQYDLLPIINEVNGDALLRRKIHEAWFGAKPGGYRWSIVQQGADREEVPADLTPEQAGWLAQLNQDWALLERQLGELYDLQWRLNALWWKLGRNPDGMWPQRPPGVTNAALEWELNPANADSTADRLVQQLTAIRASLARVPRPIMAAGGTEQEAYARGVEAFARQKGLLPNRELKAGAAPRFWQATDPVIVIAGVEPPPGLEADERLVLRTADQLIIGLRVGGRVVEAGAIGKEMPTLAHLDRLPALVGALLQEGFFLDPASAASIAGATGQQESQVAAVMAAHRAADYLGTLPQLGLAAWQQPWSPVHVEWKVNYTHIPYMNGTQPNWCFDGNDYHLDPAGGSPSVERRDVGGISLLSPHAQFVFGARLRDFVTQYGSESELDELYQWISEVHQWQFLAQKLTGFNELLALHDSRPYRRPAPGEIVGAGASAYPLANLIGYPDGPSALLADRFQGQVGSVPYLPNGPVVPFHGVRQGQVYFKELFLYDKFGRVLHVIQNNQSAGLFDAKNFPLIRDAALYAHRKMDAQIAAVAQLPPRLLQHARLDFDLVDGRDMEKSLGLQPDVNPIAGWVLPNHLDQSLLLYAPDGESLGEFRLVVDRTGRRVGQWQPPPHSALTFADLGVRAPHLSQMLQAPAIREEAGFRALLAAVDATLWTIDPLGDRRDQNLSVLIGRPLALVRARLRFRLEGPPITDTSWAATFKPCEPDFLTQRFAIRLGDQATRDDGVIGYFADDEYGVFHSVVRPPDAQAYVKPIGPVGSTDDGNYLELSFSEASQALVTLLVDPRAAIHAITGILPVKRVEIPVALVKKPLAQMEVCFRLGPVLTQVQPTPAQGEEPPTFPEAIRLPLPAEQNGRWSWWESEQQPAQWRGYDLVDAPPNTGLQPTPNTLREGFLQLLIDLTKESHHKEEPDR